MKSIKKPSWNITRGYKGNIYSAMLHIPNFGLCTVDYIDPIKESGFIGKINDKPLCNDAAHMIIFDTAEKAITAIEQKLQLIVQTLKNQFIISEDHLIFENKVKELEVEVNKWAYMAGKNAGIAMRRLDLLREAEVKAPYFDGYERRCLYCGLWRSEGHATNCWWRQYTKELGDVEGMFT